MQAKQVSAKAEEFFAWLNENEINFSKCIIEKNGDVITLCDQTKVSYKELKSLFSKTNPEIISSLQEKKISVEVVCDDKSEQLLTSQLKCNQTTENPMMKKVTGLHGLYLPSENKIYIKSTATNGIIIHEFLHYLQTLNKEKVYGKIYKAEKNQLRIEIEKRLDELIEEIKIIEGKKEKKSLKPKLAQFMKLNGYMIEFGKWQDLIDERSLFLLYKKFEKDFNIGREDMQLIQKNLQFICQRKDLKEKLSAAECG